MLYSYSVYGVRIDSETPLPEFACAPAKNWARGRRVSLRTRYFSFPPSKRKRVRSNGFHYWLTPNRRFAFVRSSLAGVFRVDLQKKITDWRPLPKESLSPGVAILNGRVLEILLTYLQPSFLLHACVPVVEGEAIGLLGSRGAGKSTLGAAFLNQGLPLLTDDIAVVENRSDQFVIQPGPPEIRLWPKSIHWLNDPKIKGEPIYPTIRKERFLLNKEGGWRFLNRPVPLQALYILSRKKKGEIQIEDLTGQKAMMALFQNVYNLFVENPALRRKQFKIASQLVQKIPVKHLSYPSGLAHLPAVRRAILCDLKLKS